MSRCTSMIGLQLVRNPKDELKTGTLAAMLQQLGLSRRDLEG